MHREYDFSKVKRGAVVASSGKRRITIMLDDEIIEHFRAKAEAVGMGYQTMISAVLRAAIAHGTGEKSEQLGARRVGARADEENLASGAVCEAVGMRLEGILRNDRVDPDGTLRHTCVYAIAR